MKSSIKKFILILLIFQITHSFLFADSDNISISSYVDKTQLGEDSSLQLTVEVKANKNIDVDPFIPQLTGLKLIGQSSSSSTSIQIINGKTSKTIQKNFVYTLSPLRKGKIVIPPISVKHKNENYKTEPITIKVLKSPTSLNSKKNTNPEKDKHGVKSSKVRIFLQTIPTKEKVYVGEPVSIVYKIFSTKNLTGLQADKMPEFSNFLKQEIFQANNINYTRETWNGMLYYTYKISEYTLFPTKPGIFRLDPMQLICSYSVPARSFFDFGSTQRKRLISSPVEIRVKPLPEKNKPEHFSGAVGSFSIKSSLDKKKLEAGKSLTYTLIISGKGNLNMFDIPQLGKIPNVDNFEPDVEIKFTDSYKTAGRKVIKYVLIPQEKGDYTIPSPKFSFFSTISNDYSTITPKQESFTVTESKKVYSPVKFTSPQGIEIEGSDIRFIIDQNKIDNFTIFYSFWWYWTVAGFAILLVLISFFYRKERDKRLQDRGYYRFKISNKKLKQDMKKVKTIVDNKDIEKFLPQVEIALKGYIANKCNISASATTLDDILRELDKYHINKTLKKRIRKFLLFTDSFRFGGVSLDEEIIREKYNEFKDIIKSLKKVDFR